MTDPHPIVLYVDDEHSNRVVFERSFSKLFRIEVAASAAQALNILAGGDVGVLIADQRMPEMSGNELLAIAKEKYPDVVRVVITAYSDLDPILKAVNDGLVARYLIKPWDRGELEKMLTWAVQVSSLGRANSQMQLRLLSAERLMTLGSIHAAIVHDMNQPLSYLLANVERLQQFAGATDALEELLEGKGIATDKRDSLTGLAQELPEIVDDLQAGCTHLSRVTNTVRAIIHPSADDNTKRCDPKSAIDFAMSVCRQSALISRVRMTYHGPEALPEVAMGSTELIQTLVNLLSNAAQAVGRSDNRQRRVDLNASEDGESLLLTVADTGPGMSEETLAAIGTPFFSERPGGIGLGVHQCKRLVGGAGGDLQFDSKEGKGTRVRIELPLV